MIFLETMNQEQWTMASQSLSELNEFFQNNYFTQKLGMQKERTTLNEERTLLLSTILFLCSLSPLSPSQYIFGYSWSSRVQKNYLNLEHLYKDHNDITCLNLWLNSECRNVCVCVCVCVCVYTLNWLLHLCNSLTDLRSYFSYCSFLLYASSFKMYFLFLA